jgi:hypothetical protein
MSVRSVTIALLMSYILSHVYLPTYVVKFFSPLISGFRRDVDKICGLLGNYTASCGDYLPTFRYNVTREDGTDTLSRNVCK